jgi:hypothetical protein
LSSKRPPRLFWLSLVFALACGVIFQSTTVIGPDETTTAETRIAIERALLSDPGIAQLWEQQLAAMTRYLEGRGAEVEPLEEQKRSGLIATRTFPDLLALNESLSGDDLSLFETFTLKRWRGEYIFEAQTTSALIRQRIQQITGLNEEQLFLVQFPLEIRLQLPGELIRTNAVSVDQAGMQTWQVVWFFDEQHSLYANSKVPLIPPAILTLADGTRVKDARAGVDFAGTGEPGSDIRLLRLEGDRRSTLANGTIAADGRWRLERVNLESVGQYNLIVEEQVEDRLLGSGQTHVDYRLLQPVVLVPGYFACSEGIFQTDIAWHWNTLGPPSNPLLQTKTGLIFFEAGAV